MPRSKRGETMPARFPIMTAQDEPEKIFGITESELCKITHEDDALKVYYLLKEIRSRGPIQPVDFSHIAPDRRGCLTCLNPECPVWQAADQNCWESQKEHDAAIAAKALEEALSTLSDLVDGRIEGLDILMAIPAEQRAESAQDDKIKEARFELGLVHDEIESLRQSTGGEQG